VHAVHVREAQRVPSYAIPVQSNPSDVTVSVDDLVRSVQADQAPDVQVDVELVDGLPARVLLDRCAGADMLILGTSSDMPGAMRSAGPVIRACLRRAPCPVVVISAAQDPRLRHEAAARANEARVPLPAGV
jgi:nucleotide-binding universal stress UspA family protein